MGVKFVHISEYIHIYVYGHLCYRHTCLLHVRVRLGFARVCITSQNGADQV